MSSLVRSPPNSHTAPVGMLVRAWRLRRRRSQMDLALDAEVSTRHVSFVESGRSAPSRAMLLRLAEALDVPLRERNALLLAAGFAPLYAERPLDDPAMLAARGTIETILRAHAPNPALAVDRHWRLIGANEAVSLLLAAVTDPALLQPPVNVLRLSLHPGGLAPKIANLPVWRAHVLDRLRRQVEVTADPILADLLAELGRLGAGPGTMEATPSDAVAIPMELDTAAGRLSLISTTTVFGTPQEVTLSELAIEAFYPADAVTGERLRQLTDPSRAPQP